MSPIMYFQLYFVYVVFCSLKGMFSMIKLRLLLSLVDLVSHLAAVRIIFLYLVRYVMTI